jgi:putative DNA primase/helicase
MNHNKVADHIRYALNLLINPGNTAEVRAIYVRTGPQCKVSADPDELVTFAWRHDGKANNIYVTLNPISPDIPTGQSASEEYILKRNLLLLDFDPVRDGNISSTNEEHELAAAAAKVCSDALQSAGWPDPIIADSGNGTHLLYRIDLPNTEDSAQFVRSVLAAISQHFSTDRVWVDTGNYDAPRITKLYGTMARKGTNTAERPHRRSKLLEVPDPCEVVSREQLQAVADTYVPEVKTGNGKGSYRSVAHLEYCFDKGAETLLVPEIESLANSQHGEHNTTLNKVAFLAYQLVAAHRADEDHITATLESVARGLGHDEKRIQSTLKSARDAGFADPLWAKQPGWMEGRINPQAKYSDYADGPVPAWQYGIAVPLIDQGFVSECAHEGSWGTRNLVLKILAGRIRYDNAEKAFYFWNGNSFSKDRTSLINDAVLYAKAQYCWYATALRDQAEALSREIAEIDDTDLTDEQRQQLSEIKRLRNTAKAMQAQEKRLNEPAGVNAVVDFLKDARPLAGDEWDQQDMILAVANGVVDLTDGTLKQGHPRDLIRTSSPTVWKGIDAQAPRWEQFISEIFSEDQEMVNFLQRLIGYGLTGNPKEHVGAFFYGQGRNGKGVLVETLHYVLGNIANLVNTDIFMGQDDGSAGKATPHLMSLQGKRIAYASEIHDHGYVNVPQFKRLTGGDDIVGRPLHGNEIAFKNTFLPILLTNHKPVIPGDDYAMQQRVLLIPFTQSFVEEPTKEGEHPVDRDLSKKLRNEAPGILAWAVRGNIEYQRIGLNPPESVKAETRKYLAEQDLLQQFIDDCAEEGEGFKVPAGALWDRWQSWCYDQGIKKPGQQKTFNERLKRHGFTQTAPGNRKQWHGLRLKEDVAPIDLGDMEYSSHSHVREPMY